jgi:hypothetical protein
MPTASAPFCINSVLSSLQCTRTALQLTNRGYKLASICKIKQEETHLSQLMHIFRNLIFERQKQNPFSQKINLVATCCDLVAYSFNIGQPPCYQYTQQGRNTWQQGFFSVSLVNLAIRKKIMSQIIYVLCI